MIAATSPTSHQDLALERKSAPWQMALANAVSNPVELFAMLELDPSLLPNALQSSREFPLRVPRSFIARMRKGDINDPLLKQILPLGAELAPQPDFVTDPVGDMASRATHGLLHKYHGRALLITTGACGVHCRYCFRRHFPYAEETATRSRWDAVYSYLREDHSIHEIILSGGDPLSLTDARLAELMEPIVDMTHIRRLRIHTRQPIVLPERIDSNFCGWLQSIPLQKVVVVHANHAQEIDSSVRDACHKLSTAGVTLLNQSVLLAEINDSVDVLADLSESLFAIGVLPYYLHLLDRVRGAAHFEVPLERAQMLVKSLAERLPGFLVPRLVREIPGERSKTAIPVAEIPQ